MKKKTKIILFCLIGALILVSAGVGITLATIASRNSVSGLIVDEEEIVEGTEKYDWRKNETSISYGFTKDNPCDEKFYSNGKHLFNTCDDYITNIYFVEHDTYTSICYSCEFDVSSEMQVFFIFDNGYVTKISNVGSTTRVLGGTVGIYAEDIDQMKADGKDLTNAKIVEVWVRTLSGVHNIGEGMMVDGQYVIEGTTEYDWHKTNVSIPFSSYNTKNDKYEEKIYSNGHYFFGTCQDYITDIWFYQKTYYTSICYSTTFSIADDLDVFFVLDNGYITEIHRSYGVFGPFGGTVDIIIEDIDMMEAAGQELANSKIVEVWVRTVD